MKKLETAENKAHVPEFPQILATPRGKSEFRCHTPGIPKKNPW